MRTAIWGLALLAVSSPAPPQSAPEGVQQPPVFDVGVDVVAVDASVVDGDGRPVLGLGPEDFRVEVDGRARRLVSVEYVGRDVEAPVPAPAPPVHFSSNEDAPRGRLVLVLVDRGNIGRGGGRDVLKAADRFLDTLAPADRVGLAFVPGPLTIIEFTSDLDAIRRGLTGVVGTADRDGFQVPLTEAVAFVKYRDRRRWDEFVNLQCEHYKIQEQQEDCRRQMEAEANQVYMNYRDRSLATQQGLRAVLEGLTQVEGQKTVAFISAGLGTESHGDVRALSDAAARARVTLFVLLLETPVADASFGRSEPVSSADRDLETQGLYELAGLSRGAVLKVVGTGDGAFQRIARELMGYYLLGFEPEGSDRDGKSHSVKVEVARPGTTVRARGLLVIPAAAPTSAALLIGALRAPLGERAVPVQVAAYALSGTTAGKVRLLLSARARAPRPLSFGFVLSGPDGKVVASRAYQGISGGEGDWVDFTAEATVEPAAYVLRLAVVDAAGRRGSVEHKVKAALVSAGGVEVSDLVLAPVVEGKGTRPAVDLEVAGALSALVELRGSDPARVAGAAVAVELAESEAGPAILRVPAELGPADANGVRTAQVTVASGLLPPGGYTARASVLVDGKQVAELTRPFRVVPPPASSAASAPLSALLVDPPPFDRADLLTSAVLGHFVGRLSEIVPGPAPADVAAAMEEARQGRPAAMLDRLGAPGKEDPRSAFLRGVSFYARGNLPAAVTQLQAALRLNSEMFPAAVYVGACYAASAKDLDAIGAWQTALLGEGGSPIVYALLGDALLRVKEAPQAVEILNEGLAAFPDDAGLRRRLGIAYAMAGRSEDALPLLTAWVDAHPEDQPALFATLALLFQGFSREATGTIPPEERQRLTRYAKAYVDGKGPNREVVERWLRYLEARPRG
jgi:VWFA-related protein